MRHDVKTSGDSKRPARGSSQAAAAAPTARRIDGLRLDATGVLALQRSIGNAGVAAFLRGGPAAGGPPGRPLARMALAVKGLKGETLDTDQLLAIENTVIDAYALGDHGYIQRVMADLRVKDPKGWLKVDQLLSVVRTLTDSRPQVHTWPVPRAIERNIHRFWAGGPMKEATLDNILAMQDVVDKSRHSATPWTQYLWTSTIVNTMTNFLGMRQENPLDAQLVKLRRRGVRIVDVDEEWAHLRVATKETAEKSFWDLSKQYRSDVQAKGLRWTHEAKEDLDKRRYDKVKWLSDIVRLVAISRYGGVYMDTDIGPGTLDLRNHELYHTDPDGEIGHHAPPFRVPEDYRRVIEDPELGDSPRERVIRHADDMIPVLNYFFASRSGTIHVGRELAELFARDAIQSGMAMFGRLFVPLGKSIADKPTPYATPQERVTPWASHVAWTTEVSKGEG